MPSEGFELAVQATEVLQTYALDRAATVILLDNDSVTSSVRVSTFCKDSQIIVLILNECHSVVLLIRVQKLNQSVTKHN
jgi:hypothetical protein